MINTESVLHGFTDLKNLDHLGPIVLNQAKGIYVYDQNGKKYLDANSGLWNSVVGFDHPNADDVGIKYDAYDFWLEDVKVFIDSKIKEK